MPQKIIEFMVELTPTHEILINGRNWSKLHSMEVPVDEKAIQKNVSTEQQFFAICELRKILAKLEFVYEGSRETRGEIHATKPGIIVGRGIQSP